MSRSGEQGGGEASTTQQQQQPVPLRHQLLGACRADERLRPLLTLNLSCGAAEDRFISHLSQVPTPFPFFSATTNPKPTRSHLPSIHANSTSRRPRSACSTGVSAFPSSLLASARSTAMVLSSAQRPSGTVLLSLSFLPPCVAWILLYCYTFPLFNTTNNEEYLHLNLLFILSTLFTGNDSRDDCYTQGHH